MHKRTFNILFFIRKSRVSKSGEAPIILRLTVDGTQTSLTIPFKIPPDNWSTQGCCAIGRSKQSNTINQHLDAIKTRIYQIYRQAEIDGKNLNAQEMLNIYLNKNQDTEKIPTLVEFFNEHNEQQKQLVNVDIIAKTAQRYQTTLRYVVEFMQSKYNKSDMELSDIKAPFITAFEIFLKTAKKCSHNTSTKYLKNLKKVIKTAQENEYIKQDPFIGIKLSYKEVEKDFLTEEEIQRICSKNIENERLCRVRDFFLFSCFTGLAFSDLKGLKKEHLVIDNEKKVWIRKARQKTKNMCNIPLMSIPLSIIKKYEDHPQVADYDILLPVISNVKMNAYLKEISDICNINKKITTHTARHTYATTVCLANGASMETVAKMLGHSNTQMTRHYAKILDKSIMNDMCVVESKINITY